MDAEDEEPLGRGVPAGQEQSATTKPGQGQISSHPIEAEDEQRPPDGTPATATDLALEQDA